MKHLNVGYFGFYEKRLKKFIGILNSNGYQVKEDPDANDISSRWFVENYDKKYRNLVEKFKNDIKNEKKKTISWSCGYSLCSLEIHESVDITHRYIIKFYSENLYLL